MRVCFISLSLSVAALSLPAHASCDNGIEERLITPSKIEEGFVRATTVSYPLGVEVALHPAEYEIMTQAEYEALDEDMTFTTYKWINNKYLKTPITIATDIAKYDIIVTPDGNQFHRPIEKEINRIPIELHELVTPSYREEKIVTGKRPEPERLLDGRLKVMISPSQEIPGVANGHLKESWRQYIKTRTPATYQQVKCGEVN